MQFWLMRKCIISSVEWTLISKDYWDGKNVNKVIQMGRLFWKLEMHIIFVLLASFFQPFFISLRLTSGSWLAYYLCYSESDFPFDIVTLFFKSTKTRWDFHVKCRSAAAATKNVVIDIFRNFLPFKIHIFVFSHPSSESQNQIFWKTAKNSGWISVYNLGHKNPPITYF